MLAIYFILLILACSVTGREFRLDKEKGEFLLENNTFRFIAGCIHYFRVPRDYWGHRLRSMRATGINVLHTHLEWNTHEPSPGKFDFEGENDIVRFIEMAMEENMYVILGLGPFIGEERDFGGLPPWLLWRYPGITPRSNDHSYLYRVERYFEEVFKRITPLLFKNRGPIIILELTQERNPHSEKLLDICRRYVDEDVVVLLVETNKQHYEHADNAPPESAGIIGYASDDKRPLMLSPRKIGPSGPMINMAVETGWSAIWEHPWKQLLPVSFRQEIDRILPQSKDNFTSCSLSMFHGGTNFGFSAGARHLPHLGHWVAYTTSYDSGAPLDEAGNPNEKYLILRHAVNKFLKGSRTLPKAVRGQASYGVVRLQGTACLLESDDLAHVITTGYYPLTFENLKQSTGIVIYEKLLEEDFGDVFLHLPYIRDRAQVYLDRILIGTAYRSDFSSLRILLRDVRIGTLLQIVVENMGREYPGRSPSYKGLTFGLWPVKLGNVSLHNWTMYGFPLNDPDAIQDFVDSKPGRNPRWHFCTPTLYKANFVLPAKYLEPADTYIDTTGWGKGIIWVNGKNLGRYWPGPGPQMTLFLPGCYLKPAPEVNKMVLLELEAPGYERIVTLRSHPNIRLARWETNSTFFAFCVLSIVFLIIFCVSKRNYPWVMAF